MPRNPLKPIDLTVRAYNVGFGDSNLLTFRYPNFERHILIDFGSMRLPANSSKDHIRRIANQIKQDCNQKLDAIVATHRHKDHISGFATNKSGTGYGDIIRGLEPDIVVQPWTEHPDAPVDANVAPSLKSFHAHQQLLKNMEAFASSLHRQIRNFSGVPFQMRQRLRFLGENNISNKSAVDNLQRMANDARQRNVSSRHGGYFVYAGANSGLGHLLPNVDVHVLGPPTLKQSETIRHQVHEHPDEFWHLQAATADNTDHEGSLFPDHEAASVQPYARWFMRRLQQLRVDELFRIVRILDDALNNTSIILLFTVGTRGFLFPGDAQWENWAYAMSKDQYVAMLKNVELYKVGHHGSLNATPKSLWALFKTKGSATNPDRLISLLSTKEGVHGKPSRGSEVPRSKLLDALRAESKLLDTRNANAKLCVETTIVL